MRKFRRWGRKAWNFVKALGWRAFLVALLVATALEVVFGVMSGAYTRGQYAVFPAPLPVVVGIALLVAIAINALRKRMNAGFLLTFVVALFVTAMFIVVGYIIFSRFDFPQITSMALATLMLYQVYIAWRGVKYRWSKRRRSKKSKKSHGHP